MCEASYKTTLTTQTTQRGTVLVLGCGPEAGHDPLSTCREPSWPEGWEFRWIPTAPGRRWKRFERTGPSGETYWLNWDGTRFGKVRDTARLADDYPQMVECLLAALSGGWL